MATMTGQQGSTDGVALETLDLLEARMRRMEYIVTGSTEPAQPTADRAKEKSITSRLADLDHTFKAMSMESELVQEVLQLHAQFPDAFASETDGPKATLPPISDMLSIVLSSATQLSRASSDLTVMHDMPVPSAESSASLAELQPRIARLRYTQDRQAAEMGELRRRSAMLFERWYDVFVLSGGECWTEWDKRMLNAEKEVKRAELAKAQEKEQFD